MSDLASQITGLSNAQLGTQIQFAVASKVLDAAKSQGQAALALLDQAAQVQQSLQDGHPYLGANVNVRA
ncbi:MAG: putative motility protein [Planctomycetes bacterium]|nr:putative motility protein [Planctomycetota bacterium]